ncbi:hypothetical protein JW968_00420 [Candidatus Woesearchaeota archaeon]|nr:hypothetical protein [Candidatus Woesearchaeota archaeon]
MDGFQQVADRPYRGRHITVGRVQDDPLISDPDKVFIAYSFEGRSPGSRAREFPPMDEHGVIRTAPTSSKAYEQGNPALLLYPAVAQVGRTLLVSNGFQTNCMYTATMKHGFNSESNPADILRESFRDPFYVHDPKFGWIDMTSYEPDAPINTARISAVVQPYGFAMHIIKKGENGEPVSQMWHFPFADLMPGDGKFISTYQGHMDDTPPFEGDPLDVRVGAHDAASISGEIWHQLAPKDGDKDVRGGLAVVCYNPGSMLLDVSITNRMDLEGKVASK